MRARVLIADDDAMIRRLLELMLRDRDLDLVFVINGDQCIEEAFRQIPDAILLDLTMPGKGGRQVCAELRADPRTVAVPILISTGLGEDDVAESLKDLGAFDILSKPFTREALLEAIGRVVPALRKVAAMA